MWGDPPQVCDPVPSTGPAMTRAYGWPPASRRPSPSPMHVPVPAPVQQGAGVPAAVHWAFDWSSFGSRRKLPLASSFCPLIPVISPGVAPPVPRFTLTRQVPIGICDSAG